jgi:hypothetical protein
MTEGSREWNVNAELSDEGDADDHPPRRLASHRWSSPPADVRLLPSPPPPPPLSSHPHPSHGVRYSRSGRVPLAGRHLHASQFRRAHSALLPRSPRLPLVSRYSGASDHQPPWHLLLTLPLPPLPGRGPFLPERWPG